jgi:hypothetical protein
MPRFLQPYPLPGSSQVGVGLSDLHPKASQIGVRLSDLASIGVWFSGVEVQITRSLGYPPPIRQLGFQSTYAIPSQAIPRAAPLAGVLTSAECWLSKIVPALRLPRWEGNVLLYHLFAFVSTQKRGIIPLTNPRKED